MKKIFLIYIFSTCFITCCWATKKSSPKIIQRIGRKKILKNFIKKPSKKIRDGDHPSIKEAHEDPNKTMESNGATTPVTKKKSNFFQSIWEAIVQWIKKILNAIKHFFNSIKNKFQKTKEQPVSKEKIMVKFVTGAKVKGQLVNKTHDINGYLLAAKREAISIPYRMENLKIKYVLPEHITFVKGGTPLVEFDVTPLEIQYKYNQEQIASLSAIGEKEKSLVANGGISQKEALEIESRLNKILSEQESIEDQLKQKTIVAPFDGYVTRPEKNEVGQNSRTKRGDLFIIHDSKTLIMEGYISTSIYDDVFINDEVVITVFSSTPQVFKGKIKNKEQFSEQNTGLFKVLIHLEVDANNHLIGQPAQGSLKTKKTMYLTKVPEKAVFFDRGQMAVFIIIDNQAVKRVVQVERSDNDYLYISGLPESCTIITDEANVINNGDLVQENSIGGK